MAEKYEKKFTLENLLYSDGAPVVITGGALLLDARAEKTLAQIRYMSVTDETVKALRVSVTPLDTNGVRHVGVTYLYKDLDVKRGDEFGQLSAIVMPEGETAAFEAAVTEVIFADGSIWDGSDSVWAPLDKPRTLAEALGDEEAAKQFSIRYGSDCTIFPEEKGELWYCTCGAVNRKGESKCHFCRRVFSALKNVNIDSLKSDSAQRVESEKMADGEDESTKASKKKKGMIIALCVAVPLIIAAIAAAILVPRYTLLKQQKEDYAAAEALLAAGEFDEAESAFIALGDYSDAKQQAEKNVPYAKAAYVMDCAKRGDVDGLLILGLKRSEIAEGETVSVALYREACSLFDALGDYADSEAQRDNAEDAIEAYFDEQKLEEYQAAKTLLNDGQYLAARDAYLAMGDYRDSADMAQEAMYTRASKLYELTENYYTLGIGVKISDEAGEKSVFYIPQDVFASLGSGISSDIRDILSADGVEIEFEDAPDDSTPICEAVSALFKDLGDYKDSAEMVDKALEQADYTKPFYDLCEQGDIVGAYQWLESYTDEFELRDQWLTLLKGYAPYCGTWQFYSGDSSLLAQTVGQEIQCASFTSKVVIRDTKTSPTAYLVIYPNGDENYYIELAAVVGTAGFSYNADGVNIYYAVISSSTGRFTYSKLDSLGLRKTNYSAEYSIAQ